MPLPMYGSLLSADDDAVPQPYTLSIGCSTVVVGGRLDVGTRLAGAQQGWGSCSHAPAGPCKLSGESTQLGTKLLAKTARSSTPSRNLGATPPSGVVKNALPMPGQSVVKDSEGSSCSSSTDRYRGLDGWLVGCWACGLLAGARRLRNRPGGGRGADATSGVPCVGSGASSRSTCCDECVFNGGRWYLQKPGPALVKLLGDRLARANSVA
ncbi:hypothetical protein BGZ61DRAFT_520603 [Ilyonectria robusta]|uniref:uncharacterized protein n=1 Tax=Ilyonectria robusta TaxID=1079257 RepID=UPI001E8E7502|nr:uncharacterized protein BGZ61DRAFT_520603 [Ilyonectria robusta]KAH8677044.1 hypothetical protein BGZ61DRAFT_520603 [Ilyonectria robusta]